jgi:hypothetical protein
LELVPRGIGIVSVAKERAIEQDRGRGKLMEVAIRRIAELINRPKASDVMTVKRLAMSLTVAAVPAWLCDSGKAS